MFKIKSSKKRFDANKVTITNNGFPYIARLGLNNGQKGFINESTQYLNEGNTISFGQDTATIYYQEKPYFTGDKIKIFKPKNKSFGKHNAQFILSAMNKSFAMFSWGSSSFNVNVLENVVIQLPSKNGEINYDFINSFMSKLEAEQIAELSSYLTASGLCDYTLTGEEVYALKIFPKLRWEQFNLKTLFGKSTRGKRLKSADRISGGLAFVTAGEADEGVSAYIGNNVVVFNKNTTTIDMFGSAKYRNYNYGADDHVTVIHTEKLSKYSSIFITAALHKSSYTGEFNYGRNFYPKDADKLNIVLPAKNNEPDFKTMETLISAIHKLIIRDVVLYTEQKIKAIV